jgi:hypothetical protein
MASSLPRRIWNVALNSSSCIFALLVLFVLIRLKNTWMSHFLLTINMAFQWHQTGYEHRLVDNGEFLDRSRGDFSF